MAAICWLRRSTWVRARAVACFSASTCEPSSLARLSRALSGFEHALQAAALVLGGAERRLQGRKVLLDRAPARALEREKVGQVGDLAVEPVEDGLLGGDLLGEEELPEHEHRQHEGDGEQHRRQGVDEAGPIADAALAAKGARSRHRLT